MDHTLESVPKGNFKQTRHFDVLLEAKISKKLSLFFANNLQTANQNVSRNIKMFLTNKLSSG